MNAQLVAALGFTGQTPFPWQEELLKRFLKAEIPRAIDVPTGLGKTSVMAIWLMARSMGAKLPRRLVYVVDRRAVVDQATTEAERLRDWLDMNANAKQHLGLAGPLPISTLRGQYVDNREWLEDPTGPAIIVGTVDMVGSRLLFEGYGVSRKMRPYHAALLGSDTLVVLDEAHLVPPFEHLLQAVATEPSLRPSDNRCSALIPTFHVIALAATARTRGEDVMGLTPRDFEHEVVKKRLNAKKFLRIEALPESTKIENALASHAWTLADNGQRAVRILVYRDSRDVAQKAKAAVEKLAKGTKNAGKPAVNIETELLVGGRRVFERGNATGRLKSLGFIAGSTVEHRVPVFLFATSAGEVGVDLDADHMVCDLVALERMVQRLGRVNRRGEGDAGVVVIARIKPDEKVQQALDKRKHGEKPSSKELSAIEGWESEQCRLEAIKKLRKVDNGVHDASPGALLELKARAASEKDLHRILREATTPEPLRPALTRPLLDAWAMTSIEKHTGRPVIQPWLRGWTQDDPQTALVWRWHLPVRAGGPAPREKEVERFFEAAPPHTSEILETQTDHVVKWLAARAQRTIEKLRREATQDGAASGLQLSAKDPVAFALDPDGGVRRVLKLEELSPREDKDKQKLDRLLANATLVVDARLAGLRDGLLDDGEDAPPRTADDGQEWLAEGAVGFRVRRVEASVSVPRDKNWRERFRFPSVVTEDGEATRWLIVEKWRSIAATEEDRSAARPQLLDEHALWTEARARRLAMALGLDDALAEALALAARLHDEGKRATRWQRAFHAPKDGVYAKTEGPIDYRMLDGYRHELGSLLRIENDERIRKLPEEHRDLVLHLIAAHHGFARPAIDTSGCDDAPPSALEAKAAEIALRFARLQARWGPWGLAWWEALLRAADQQASRDNDERTAAEGGM